MTRIHRLVLILLVATAVPSEARIVLQRRGPVLLDCPAGGPIALSDTIHVILAVEGSPALVVAAPETMPADASWLVVERKAPVREPLPNGRERWHFNYRFAPRAAGTKVPFKFPAVSLRDGKEERTVSFDPVFYDVTTQIKDADLAQLHDITAIEPLPPVDLPDADVPWWQSAAIGAGRFVALLGLVLALVFVWRWWRGRKIRSPAELALREWHRLVAMKLPEKGQSERFITLLTTVVRRFLERQFSLPARRQTTPEFLRELAQNAALSAAEKRFLESFLSRCETVKFAHEIMAHAECEAWTTATRQFLEGRLDRQAGQSFTVEKNAQTG